MTKKLVFAGVILIVLFHFYIISFETVSYPFFGDDWDLLSVVRKFSISNLNQWGDLILPFHGGVHSHLLTKIFALSYFTIFNEIDYKALVLISSLLILVIYTVYFKYLKLLKKNSFHFLTIAFILFSLKGNLDNFNLGGIMQHNNVSICFITLISYLVVVQKKCYAGVFLGICYLLFVSSEAIGVLLISNLCCFLFAIRGRVILLGISLGTIVLYYFGVRISQEILGAHSAGMVLNWGIFVAPFIFMGGIFTNIKLAGITGFLLFLSILIPTVYPKKPWRDYILGVDLFIPMVALSIASVGIILQVNKGTSALGAVDFSILTNTRFSLYHLLAILLGFLSTIKWLDNKFTVIHMGIFCMAGFYYLVNIVQFYPTIIFDKERVLADIYNYNQNNFSVLYYLNPDMIHNNKKTNWMYVPTESLNLNNFKAEPVKQSTFDFLGSDFVNLMIELPQKSLGNYFLLETKKRKIIVCAKTSNHLGFSVLFNRKSFDELGEFNISKLTKLDH
ncbi:MAG: hypothetical protein RI995_1436 [Bacteroidota bacterium]|jgi:hypothetical protein